MRILLVHNAYAQAGGEDTVVRAELEGLRARGHEVQLLGRDSKELFDAPLRGAAETLCTVANPEAARQLSRALTELRPDVVHLHNLFPRWGLSVLRTLHARGTPTVQTLHNFRWLCAPATFLRDGADCRRCATGNFASAVRFGCMRRSRVVSAAYALALAANRASGLAERAVARFICVSEFVRTLHREAGFDPAKLVVKGHFVTHAPGALGPGDGSVIYAGRLSAEKGLGTLWRALPLLPDVTLKIAGDSPERAQLEADLAQLPARRARVIFLGRLTREALLRELQQSSVCVVPSLGSETFGLSALEALACGCPVVATDAGGLPELVQHGQNGFVVPRGDASALARQLRWLLERPEAARALGRAGHALVERAYLPAANLERLEGIYRDAMTSARGSLTD